MRALVFAVMACVGCYHPSYEDCQIQCASGQCPSGLHCNSEQRCVSEQGMSCSGVIDDAPRGPDASYCGGFLFPISNVTCPLTMQTGDWTFMGDQTLVATANPVVPGNPPFAQVVDNGRKLLIVAHNVTIAPNAVLTISPDPNGAGLPVIIVASGTAQIDGTINVIPFRQSDAQTIVECGIGIGGDAPSCGNMPGGGGGGGAFGPVALAGAGGACLGGTGGVSGAPNGDMSLVPLRGGCKGGAGSGFQGSVPGGQGGAGGGAIQISATTLVVGPTGRIDVGGGGGQPGPSNDGGGGGGSGGGILLEAISGTIKGGGIVCANGGGGGSENVPGTRGTCGPFAANGGPAPSAGGQGAFVSTPAQSGQSGTTAESGGGGGGGVGRIHFNGTFTVEPQGLVTPPQS